MVTVKDLDGREIALDDIVRGQKTVIAFLRHFG